jgi:hypothetical protein
VPKSKTRDSLHGYRVHAEFRENLSLGYNTIKEGQTHKLSDIQTEFAGKNTLPFFQNKKCSLKCNAGHINVLICFNIVYLTTLSVAEIV